MNPLAFLQLVSPTQWVIIGLVAAVGVQQIRVNMLQAENHKHEDNIALLQANIKQNKALMDLYDAQRDSYYITLQSAQQALVDLQKEKNKVIVQEVTKWALPKDCSAAVEWQYDKNKDTIGGWK